MLSKNKRILYISYNGMLDPLGQSQVIPYLKELAKRGMRFSLLSYERAAAFRADGIERRRTLQDELGTHGIEWHVLKYHQRPSLPATAFDVAAGIRWASRLVRRHDIELVHARAHIPAVIALAMKRRFGAKIIFDVRGLMAEEYVDAAHWRQDSLPYRITKAAERRVLAAADGVVTLTKRIWPIMKEWEALRDRDVIHEVVPCCADLDLFRFDGAERARRRQELKVENSFVIVYSGSIDGWYLTEEMADVFVALQKQKPDAHFLWLTPTRHGRIRELMAARTIREDQYTVVAAAPHDVASYLAAADAGLAFIKPCFSKLASSPTKYAEYLACGLPLIINAGVGDSDALITEEKVGALVREFKEDDYAGAWTVIQRLAGNPEQTRRLTREVAERLFDVRRVGLERYARLYERVLEN